MNFIYIFILSTVFFGVIGSGLMILGEILNKDYVTKIGKEIIPISVLFFILSIFSSGEWVMIGCLLGLIFGLLIITYFILQDGTMSKNIRSITDTAKDKINEKAKMLMSLYSKP